MFKFDHQQALTYQPLGSGHESSVYAYLEGQDENKWVVKCLRINDPDKVNTLLQNILITTSANCGSVVPIKGHDIHRGRQGDITAYLKMPRMQQSLQDLIQHYRTSKQTVMPLEKIVHYFHSIVNCLDELAQKEIAHRNLKPSNVLFGYDGQVYLSDIKMVDPSGPYKATEIETKGGNDEDLLYKAPETFYDNWALNDDDLHKADAWSLGMVIARACLIDSLIPISLELPMEDNKDIIEQNMTMIAERYGHEMAGIVRRLLALNAQERETFSTTRMLLEETFPMYVVGCPNGGFKGDIPNQEHKIIIEEESPIIEDICIERQVSADNNFLIWNGSQGFNRPRWMQFRRPNWLLFKQRFKFRPLGWSNKDSLKQGLRKGKDLAKRFKVAILISIALLLLVLISLHLHSTSRRDKFVDIMTGIQIKHENYFKIDFDRQGSIDIEAIQSSTYYNRYDYDPNAGEWVVHIKTLNDEIVGNLMNDIVTQLASVDLDHHLKKFRFLFLPNCQVTDSGLSQLETSLIRMKKLQEVAIEQINGPTITSFALQRLFRTLSEELKDLDELCIGLLGINDSLNLSEGDTQILMNTVLSNAKKLKAFHFFLDSTKLSDEELHQLAYIISERGRNLETLNIRLRGFSYVWTEPKFSTTGLKNFNSIFISNLNNLRDLRLDYSGSPMTDEVLDMVGTSVVSHGKKLKRFTLLMDNCDLVTDGGLKYFGYQLSKENKSLHFFAIQPPSHASFDTRNWLRDQLKYVSEVRIMPEY